MVMKTLASNMALKNKTHREHFEERIPCHLASAFLSVVGAHRYVDIT